MVSGGGRQRGAAAPGNDDVSDRVTGALLVHDVLDAQLLSADHQRIGRVGDVELEWDPADGLRVTAIEVGPQALLGRLSGRLRGAAMRVLGERYLHRIEIGEVDELSLAVRLAQPAEAYAAARGDRWVADHILRRIPGHGRPSR